MQIDLEQIRRHYASLSDEALLDIDRADLTEAAQRCFDAEFDERGLGKLRKTSSARPTLEGEASESDDESESVEEIESEPASSDGDPDWLSEAAQVYSAVDQPGASRASDSDHARAILNDAGIPCHLQLVDLDETTREWRLLVPGHLNMQAASILDRDIFNQDFENEWRTHLEQFADDELPEMHPEVVFCGLFDRVERAVRAYDEELARRGLKG